MYFIIIFKNSIIVLPITYIFFYILILLLLVFCVFPHDRFLAMMILFSSSFPLISANFHRKRRQTLSRDAHPFSHSLSVHAIHRITDDEGKKKYRRQNGVCSYNFYCAMSVGVCLCLCDCLLLLSATTTTATTTTTTAAAKFRQHRSV